MKGVFTWAVAGLLVAAGGVAFAQPAPPAPADAAPAEAPKPLGDALETPPAPEAPKVLKPVNTAPERTAPMPTAIAPRGLKLPGGPPPASLQNARRPHPGVQSPLPEAVNPKITNYFKYLKKTVAEEEAKPLPEPKKPGENLTAPRTYPFDAIENLSSRDIMRAVREGIKLARLDHYNQPEDVVNHYVEENIRFALEYYPIVAVDQDAMNNLYYVMEDSHAEPLFRRLLFLNAVPGRDKDSLFARFLQEGLRLDLEHTYRMYGSLVMGDQEDPAIRALAMQNQYRMKIAEFSALLAKDAAAKAFREANQRDPQPKDLLDGKTFVPSPSAKMAIAKMQKAFEDMAKLWGDLLKNANKAPIAFRKAIVAQLTQMKDEVPLTDAALIDGYLADAAKLPAEDEAKATSVTPAPAKPGEDALAF